jgi:23S rRNA pseudouridine2605 synthase
MTEDHEHEAEPLEQDITSEADDLDREGSDYEAEDIAETPISHPIEVARTEDEEEDEEEPEDEEELEDDEDEEELDDEDDEDEEVDENDEDEDEEEPEYDEDEEEEEEGEEEEEELKSVSPARPAAKLERLQKILAQAGVASRRHAEELITEGRVQVNGQVVTVLGSKADPTHDHIRVDGKLLQGAERLRYFMLNKPKGYVTTVTDPEGRPTIMDFFTKMGERLYPVGRLDYLSEGLLLVTNDGELANGLTKAASGVEKTYLVKVAGQPDEAQLDRLREGGVSIERGRPGEGKVRTAPARIRQVRHGDNPWYEVVLIEGRNRELRKMFEEIGHHVEKIRRVGYGPLVLDLEPGKLRELDPQEISALRLTAEGKLKPRRMKTTAMLPKEAGRSTEERERGFRPGPRSGKPGAPRTAFRPRTDKPFERDDRPRQANRGTEGEGYAGRREGRAPSRSQDHGANRQQGRPQRPFRSESGFDRPRPPQGAQSERTERPAAGSGRFAARPGAPSDRSSSMGRRPAAPGDRSSSTGRRTGPPADRSSSMGRRTGGQRPYRGGPPTDESRTRPQRPYSDRPARTDRPRRREEGFRTEAPQPKPFRPRSGPPSFEITEAPDTSFGKRPQSGGRGFKSGPGQTSGRSFERPAANRERPPRREGEAPAWRGKARPSSGRPAPERRERPATGGGRSKPAFGSKPPRAGAPGTAERTGERSGDGPRGFRPKSGPGRPSNGAKRSGPRPGGKRPGGAPRNKRRD